MIPKIIHYCWFGHGPKPELIQKCMASWKRFLPEYELKEWNEDNFDFDAIPYAKEAYEHRRWAFVSDCARLYALYHDGGIYMDTDVEVLKPIDRFLSLPAFSGFQTATCCLTGIMGSEKGGRWVKELLDDYQGRHFIHSDGTFNESTNVYYTTKLMREKYHMVLDGHEESVAGYVTFFPTDYFCPKTCVSGEVDLTENTYTIHHFAGSWLGKRRLVCRKLAKRHPMLAHYLNFLTSEPKTLMRRMKRAIGRRLNRWFGMSLWTDIKQDGEEF